MRIVFARPPNWAEIIAVFPQTRVRKAVFAYGDTIYNPAALTIPPHLVRHEKEHQRQQNGDPAAWWKRYLADVEFRLQQETEAYGAQYAFICRQTKSQKDRFRAAHSLAEQLGGDLYGNIVTPNKALGMIMKAAKLCRANGDYDG